jgi:hypothetical protein
MILAKITSISQLTKIHKMKIILGEKFVLFLSVIKGSSLSYINILLRIMYICRQKHHDDEFSRKSFPKFIAPKK